MNRVHSQITDSKMIAQNFFKADGGFDFFKITNWDYEIKQNRRKRETHFVTIFALKNIKQIYSSYTQRHLFLLKSAN